MPKVLLAIIALIVSALQAWDSHALDAEPAVQILILAGVLLPAFTLLATTDMAWRGGAVTLAALCMVGARMWSDQPMPGLALAAFFPGILILLDHVRTLNETRSASGASRLK